MKTLRTALILVASAAVGAMLCCGCSNESDRFPYGPEADPMGFEYPQGFMMEQGFNGPSGEDNFWSSGLGAGNYDSDNQRGYVNVPGHGPVGYGF